MCSILYFYIHPYNCEAVIHSFLYYTVFYHMNIPLFIYPFIVGRHLMFSIWLCINIAIYRIFLHVVRCTHVHTKISMCLLLANNTQQFSKMLNQYIYMLSYQQCGSIYSSLIYQSFHYTILVDVKKYPIFVIICTSLMINEVQHHFVLLAMCIS